MECKIKFKILSRAALLLALPCLYTPKIFAANSVSCEPLNSGATSYENSLLHDLKSEENKKAFSFEDGLNGGQQGYQISCNCSDDDATSSSGVQVIYSLQTSLSTGHALNYYKVNEHLDVMTQIIIPNNSYVTVPTVNAVIDKTLHRDKNNNGVC